MASQFIIPNPTANQTALGHYSGFSYDAGITAGREAGIGGQAPPVANISIDVLCARFGEIPLAQYDFSSEFKHKYPLLSSKKNIELEFRKRRDDYDDWENPKYYPDGQLKMREPFPLKERRQMPKYRFDDLAALRDLNARDVPPQKITPQQRDKVDLTTPEYKAGVVVGYVAGITAYVAAQGLLKSSMSTPTVLFSEFAWQAYAKGLALETPEIPRTLFNHLTGQSKSLQNETESEIYSRVVDAQRTVGYSLGFAVRIAREYGVALDVANTPSNNESYNAFMRGLRGELNLMKRFPKRMEEPTYNIPSRDKGSSQFFFKEDLNLIKTNDPEFEKEILVYVDQNMYKVGQQVRLAAGK